MRGLIIKYMRLCYLFAAIISFGLGGLIAVMGNNAGNPVLIAVGVGGLAGGVLLGRKWYWQQGSRYSTKVFQEPPNCLSISKDIIEFVHLAEKDFTSLTQKCHNDGKYYYVQKVEGENKSHFELPDDDENERCYEPTEMANVVTMPSNKKYFTWSSTLMQKIYAGIMTIVIAAEIVGLVAMGG